jgi:hypothetical protein
VVFSTPSVREQFASSQRAVSGEIAARRKRTPAVQRSDETDVKAAFLRTKQGLLVASKVRAGEKAGDEDLLVATLNIIQNFMLVSFPILKGKRLRSISQGDPTLVTETGKHLFLTVVIRGEDSRALRERMRAALKGFEDSNKALFAHWDGTVEAPQGADETLLRLFQLTA